MKKSKKENRLKEQNTLEAVQADMGVEYVDLALEAMLSVVDFESYVQISTSVVFSGVFCALNETCV